MNILWITNITMPPVCESLGLPVPAVGGWMYSSLRRVIEQGDMEFAVATVWNGNETVKRVIDGITYYLLPLHGKPATAYNSHLEPEWREIASRFQPDVVHIHGSEFPHGLAYVRAVGPKGVAVSIQGLLSVYKNYYYAGISDKDILRNITFRDMLRGSLWRGKRNFEKRACYEVELLKSVSHIIGRTSWDRDNTYAINPEAGYHFCNETLRESFYSNRWSYCNCEKHTIFVSQAGYPIKGLHKLLDAMPMILREYPDAKIYVGGMDIVHKPLYRLDGYGRYIKRQIDRYGLERKVIFRGMLNEREMCDAFLQANVFVCSSSIENSPNSLGEAQLLGVPSVASYVGGVSDMVPSPECGAVYRFEETAMLAAEVCEAFRNAEQFDNTAMRDAAALRHDPVVNARRLAAIYTEIV